MTYRPGQENSGSRLTELWRQYLEEYADREGDPEGQIIAGANSAVEILVALSQTLNHDNLYDDLIDQRLALYEEGKRQASVFADRLLNATFSIYNSLNTLAHQFAKGNTEAVALIKSVDEQAHLSIASGTQVDRSAAAMRASFALLGLMTIAADEHQAMTVAIRKLEQRFGDGARACTSDWDHLLNALYRAVEMLQLFTLITDSALKDQVAQTASRFQEEDQNRDILLKMRNGFCRLFELGYILVTRVDALV